MAYRTTLKRLIFDKQHYHCLVYILLYGDGIGRTKLLIASVTQMWRHRKKSATFHLPDNSCSVFTTQNLRPIQNVGGQTPQPRTWEISQQPFRTPVVTTDNPSPPPAGGRGYTPSNVFEQFNAVSGIFKT